MNSYFKRLLPYFIGVGIIVIVCMVFLAPQLSGKVIQGEGAQNAGMIQESKKYYEEHKEYTFWTNSMFGGMPTYAMYGGPKAGVANYIASALMLFRNDSLGYLLVFALSSFLGLIFLGVGPWIALLGALAATFATTHIGVLEAGHNSKLASAGFSMLILAGIYRLFLKDYVLGGLAFTLGIALSLGLGHPQMTYYSMLAAGVVALFLAFRALQEKSIKSLGMVAIIGLAGILMALGANLYQSYTMRKYAADTMRGGSILTSHPATNSRSVSSDNGLGFEYAMGWSDGVRDLLAFVIPGAVGGSNAEKVKGNQKISQLLRKSGLQPQPVLPLYWGDLAFTASPDYVGGVIILLFLLGLFYIKGPLKWGLVSATLLLILMSLGKNFEVLNRFLFDYLPMLNKFRTPNSIHNVSVCLIALFAMLGLKNFLDTPDHKKAANLVLKVGGGLLAFIFVFGLGGGMFFDFTSVSDGRYDPKIASIFREARSIYLSQDSIRTLIFVALGLLVLYFYQKEKLKKNLAVGLLTLITLVDLFGVARRYISTEDWKPASALSNPITARSCDQQILLDKTLHYRVYDLSTGDPFQSAASAYFHKMVGGYSPAKLRRYQDIIDAYLVKGDEKVLNMLNTKYIIDQQEQVIPRPEAFGNAWLVNNIKVVNSPDEEIASIEQIDPLQTTAVLDAEFPGYIAAGTSYTKSGNIDLVKYSPNALQYTTNVQGDQFAVFSEIWYGSGRGWQAYVDGKPVEHIRVDYILRGLKIPSGQHTIDFKFEPKQMLTAMNIGWWLNNLVGLILLGGIGWWLYEDYKKYVGEKIAQPGIVAPKTEVSKNSGIKTKGKK